MENSRGKFTETILVTLQHLTDASIDMIEVAFSGYYEAYRKTRRVIAYGPKSHFKTDWVDKYQERQKFYNLLYYLQKQGLVTKNKVDKKSFWSLTRQGKEKLKTLKESGSKYPLIKDNKLRLIIFDIPEKERGKRIWLRRALLTLKFNLLQKSVWIGNVKLPEIFIKDLRKLKILSYIHILEINKTGSLEKINFN